jgi:cytochrome c peroxidase
MQIFNGVGNCNACHGSDNFVPGPNINNNGLENPYVDKGVGALTGLPLDEGLFKVPSLRNIELTAPYMHDGTMATLEEVIDHYKRGGRLIESGPLAGDGFLSPFKSGLITGFPLSDRAKADILEFLKSLTDQEFVNDPRFSDPFAEE